MLQTEGQWQAVNLAFSKQSARYDEDDLANPILQRWRQRVYAHVDRIIKPNASILELNAGTGIDALRFVHKGHRVHATDLSDGMIRILQKKIIQHSLEKKTSVQQVSFENLSVVEGKFDFVFSNFGGLNCLENLSVLTRELTRHLNEGGYLTFVIMPPFSIWELSWMLKGQIKNGLRRVSKRTLAHVEGEYFTTYYHSLRDIRKALGPQFKLVGVEGLGVFSPPPSATSFSRNHPVLTKFLNMLDQWAGKTFPFNRCGDHLIVTFGIRK